MMRELISTLKAKGQLDGVEIDIDEGEPTDHGEESRDEAVVANIAVGVVKRVKAVCELGKYDAIITQAGIEPGFLAARMVSTLPIAYPVHSAMHFASLLGEKFCVLTTTDAQAMIVRRNAQLYGLNHKLTSVRYVSRSSTFTMALVRKYKKAERMNSPEVMATTRSSSSWPAHPPFRVDRDVRGPACAAARHRRARRIREGTEALFDPRHHRRRAPHADLPRVRKHRSVVLWPCCPTAVLWIGCASA